ncbi:hypothetical protein [Shewanella sp. SR44-3]|uniref:hypothetical protein n=1 Tax=unclassified Shewanella TaxID=196818 RepID=UPI0015FB3389|nr:hypothetical protein [Shewanella sp. SR44-3]MBB1270841.1 hypothetical protein [Shewanella sp. SR44-3]
MKHLLPFLGMLFLPNLAMAHEGHHGVGLFHHVMDLAPGLTLFALIALGILWAKKR